MLNRNYRYIGIARVTGGSYGVYWVTDFSSINPERRLQRRRRQHADADAASADPGRCASITSPAPGSTINSPSQTFSWTAASGADEYFFYAGTSRRLEQPLRPQPGTQPQRHRDQPARPIAPSTSASGRATATPGATSTTPTEPASPSEGLASAARLDRRESRRGPANLSDGHACGDAAGSGSRHRRVHHDKGRLRFARS